jgi:uncharacterized protein YceH (UPF0502 family)
VAGTNQKSNRDPEMHAEDYEIEGALRSLREKGWIVQMEREGGRALRWAHQAERQLGVDGHDLAILAELLLRGPQTPQELKTRCSRMRPFASPEQVEQRLRALSERPVPFVRLLPRRPRERDARWTHLLGASPTTTPPAGAPATEGGAAGPVALPSRPAAPTVLERLEALERAVEELRARLPNA